MEDTDEGEFVEGKGVSDGDLRSRRMSMESKSEPAAISRSLGIFKSVVSVLGRKPDRKCLYRRDL